MFVGRSEEEVALAGEEMGWSPLQALKNVFESPAAVAAILGPAAGAAAGAALAIKAATSRQAAPAPKPKGKAPAPAADDGGDASADAPPKKPQGTASVGAEAYSDDHIAGLIARERDPDKRQRMVYNHERAKRMRNGSVGAALGVVEESIGELFARTPVDANTQPTLDKGQVHQLVSLVAKKTGDRDGARRLVASYIRMNQIATPGLKVVKTQ